MFGNILIDKIRFSKRIDFIDTPYVLQQELKNELQKYFLENAFNVKFDKKFFRVDFNPTRYLDDVTEESSKKPNLNLDMIDEKLLSQYEVYMRISNLCRNTTSFYMRILRSIYNRAVNEGHTIQTNPFKNVYTGVDKTCKRAITLQEIKRIKNMDLSDMPKLDFARDIFMFSFYMRGMSFIDIAYLKKTDLSGGFLVYNRKKTGQQLIVKWEKDMDNIVQKYADENENNAFLFPIIERQDGTERKQYLNKMLIINRRLKTISKMGNISTPLTMYVARHSWASIAQSKNIPVHTISLAMGHDNEETTRIYLATIQNNVIDKANNKIISLLNRRE